jgi:hypothetical protein
MKKHRCSPEVAYQLISLFNERWNIQRARDNRGRDDGFKHCFDQPMMEHINVLTAGFLDQSLFSIRSTYDFAG